MVCLLVSKVVKIHVQLFLRESRLKSIAFFQCIDDSINRTFEIMKGYCILLLTRKACEYFQGGLGLLGLA